MHEKTKGGHEPATQKIIDEFSNQLIGHLNEFLDGCESPIEKILALRLYEFMHIREYRFYQLLFEYDIDVVDIEKQRLIKINNTAYRVDFLITVFDMKTKEGYGFVVECDGHEYHEKTKSQAQKDKKRDRDMTTEGFTVLRFTGSEIYNNKKIGGEVFSHMRDLIAKRRGGKMNA